MKIGISAQEDFKNLASFEMGEFELPVSVLKVCVQHEMTPIILPTTTSEKLVEDLVSTVDGIIITGGSDVGTQLYDEKPLNYNQISCMPSYSSRRDDFEIMMIKAAWQQRKPILGLCRGIQILNVAFGGSLYQNLDTQFERGPHAIEHFQEGKSMTPTHSVSIAPGTHLYDVMGNQAMVNSYHHQAVKKVGKGLRVTAKAPDGLVEGVETTDGLFQAVQWHPEQLWERYSQQDDLFKNFFHRVTTNYAKQNKRAVSE